MLEELRSSSPATRQSTLNSVPRATIQKLAKEAGVKANGKTVDIVASLLERLSSLDKLPETLGSTVTSQPIASTHRPNKEDPTAASQQGHAHTDVNILPAASEALPTSDKVIGDEGVADIAQMEAAASTPSKLSDTQQYEVELAPATSTCGGSKRRGKGPKATPAAKKRKVQQLQDEAGKERPEDTPAHTQSQTMPAPPAHKSAGNVEETTVRKDAELAEDGTHEASGTQVRAVVGPAPEKKQESTSLEIIPEDVKPADDGAAEQERGTASCEVTAEDFNQSAGSFAAMASTKEVQAGNTVQQEGVMHPTLPAETPAEFQHLAVGGQQAPSDAEEVPSEDDVGKPEGSPKSAEAPSKMAEVSALPAPMRPAEPVPESVSQQHAEIPPVNPAASPIKPDVEMEDAARHQAPPACQTDLLPALDAAPDATILQDHHPVDDWIVDPDEAAAEADMKPDTIDSNLVYGALGEQETRLLAALAPAESPRSVQNRHLLRLSHAPSLITWSGSDSRVSADQNLPVEAQDKATAGFAPSSSPVKATQQAPQGKSFEPNHASAGAEGQPMAAGHPADGEVTACMETDTTPAAVTVDAQGAAGWVSNPMFDEPSEAMQVSAGNPILAGTSGGVMGTEADGKPEAVLEKTDAGGQIVAVPGGRPPSGRERQSGVDGLNGAQKRAFERGRKSGIWHGAKEVELHHLENEWDTYKANATRGWTVPSLEEVQAESEKLAAAGYTTVGTPNLRASSRNAIQKRQGAAKRKAAEDIDASRPPSSKIARRSVSQGAPGSAQRPQLRASRFGAKENASVGTPSRLSHMIKGQQTPVKMNMGDCADSATPLHAARQEASSPGAKAAAAGAAKAPGGAQLRAQKAEALYAARRAAALAKARK